MIHICKVVLKYLGWMRSLNLPLLSCKLFERNKRFQKGIFYTGASVLQQQLAPQAPLPSPQAADDRQTD